MTAQMATLPPDLAQVAPKVPPALAALVMQCLAKDPAARPPNADALLAVLESISGIGATANDGARGAGSERTVTPARRMSPASIGVAAVVLLLAVPGVWWLRNRGTGVAPDARSIAVAPFRVGGAVPAVRYLREGIADLMVPQLQSIRGVHAPGTRVVLERWRRAAGAPDADLEDDKARRVASEVGAAELVMGEIVGSAERLTVSARLLRVSDGAVLATANVVGPADSVPAHAARITTELLALRDGATRDRLRAVMSAKPEALIAYLTGERAYRAGHYEEAGKAYAEAFRSDTTFALAALRISASNGWIPDRGIPGSWFAAAWRHRDKLTGTDSLLLLSTAGATYPKPMPLRELLRFRLQLAEAGRSAELWTAYADLLFHDGEAASEPNVFTRSLEAFQRAESLDSSFAAALEHQAHLHLFLGDTAAAQADVARQDRRGFTDQTSRFNHLAVLNAQDVAGLTPLLDSFPPFALAAAAVVRLSVPLVTGAMDVPLSDALMQRAVTLGYRGGEFPRELYLLTGRPSRIPVLDRQAATPEQLAEDLVGGLLGDGDSEDAAHSASTLAQWTRQHPSDSLSTARAVANFYAGLWAVRHGDTAAVERTIQALRALKPPANAPWERSHSLLFEELLSAHLALARSAPDLTSRLQRLDSLLIDTMFPDRRLMRAVGNLLLADLWERAGDPQKALAAIRRRDGEIAFFMLAASRVRRDARLSERLGQTRDAIAALRVYVKLRALAEPPLQRDLADARATLQRLEATVR